MFDATTNRIVNVVSARPRLHKRSDNLIPGANPNGKAPKAPKKGAKGIAGIRWDILHGTLTVREFTMLSLKEISKRYRVYYPSSARYCREYIAKHGAGK